MKIGLFGPFSVKERRGNSIRILLQAEGFLKNGFDDFCLYSYEKNTDLTTIKQEEVGQNIFPKQFPYLQKIKKLPCDVVHVHHFFGAMPLRQKYILDMPSYITLQLKEIYKHEGRPFKRWLMSNFFIPWFIWPEERRVILGAAAVIVASESIKNDILATIPEADPGKIFLITNPVKAEIYKISEIRELIVGAAASSFEDKMDRACLDAIYEIAQRMIDVRFKIAGKMSEEQRERLAALKNVEILGVLKHEEYLNFLSAISVFLNPYLSFWDYGGSKFKLLEAGAAGLAVISSENGAIGFEHKEALEIANTVEEIERSIGRLRDFGYRSELGAKLREIILREHNYIDEAKKLIDIYNKI